MNCESEHGSRFLLICTALSNGGIGVVSYARVDGVETENPGTTDKVLSNVKQQFEEADEVDGCEWVKRRMDADCEVEDLPENYQDKVSSHETRVGAS